VRLIEEDPELAERLSPDRRDAAARQLVTTAFTLGPGKWTAPTSLGDDGDLGLIVFDGVLVRSVGRAGRLGAELLGRGDLLRPWQEGEAAMLDFESTWSVVEPSRLGVLDSGFTQRLAAFPELVEVLLARTVQRTRTLAATMAIAQEPTVEARLELMLWQLADRFGKVRPNGVIVPLPLTHSVLARLVAARRPSTTTALGRLAQRGVLERRPDGWLLTGGPPGGRSVRPPVLASRNGS
jgi:CRP-like cAMP-binding protein